MVKIVLFFLAFILWPKTFAEKFAVVIGGSGEDFKKENFFLSDFDRLSKNLSSRGFQVVNVFDSAKTGNKFQALTATNENIKTSIKAVLDRAKKGDQVVLMFHTHGMKKKYTGTIGHEVLTESGDFYIADILPLLKKTEAKILITDLSCYSGSTQELIEYKKRSDLKGHYDYFGKPLEERPPPFKPKEADQKLCIITAASPEYVSICSGDKDSNAFTGAMIEELEKNSKISAEDLFKKARMKDRSFTNIPHISSFPKVIDSSWDYWLSRTDPAGLDDDQFDMASVCVDCAARQTFVQDKAVSILAKDTVDVTAKQLLEKYRDEVKAQQKINESFKAAVTSAFADLTKLEKYKDYRGWSYSKAVFFADLENVPALGGLRDHPLSKEVKAFLNSFNYFNQKMKVEMMAAMDKKQLLGQFVHDLNLKIASQKKARDENRKQIQVLASQILSYERAKYAKSFKTKEGNVCQKFQL